MEKYWNQTLHLKLEGWDYAFSCEIIARGYSALSNKEEYARYYQMATEAISELSDLEDQKLCQTELERGPW